MRRLPSSAAVVLTLIAAPASALPPPVSNLPTPATPLAQPSFATGARLATLPSGAYRLTIVMPANGRAQPRTATDAVTLTHTASTLTLAVAGGAPSGGTFGGAIDAAGHVDIRLASATGGVELSGGATGASAEGDAFALNAPPTAPHGQFYLDPADLPQARARPGGLREAIDSLLHAIGCWASGGAGC